MFEEFAPSLEWWSKREENEHAWRVSFTDIIATNYNLDQKNPRKKEEITHLPPEQLVEGILQKEQRIEEIISNIKELLKKTDEH